MQTFKLTLFIFSMVLLSKSSMAQTVENPVVINLMTGSETVSSETPSYIQVQLKLPKGIWLGAKSGEGRTPPPTKVTIKDIPGFTFEKPNYPESIEEWVPAKLGKTKVYKEEVNVIIPFSVNKSVTNGEYDLTVYLTYTPGYNAGRLSTHHKEPYSCLLYTSPSPRDRTRSRMPSSA